MTKSEFATRVSGDDADGGAEGGGAEGPVQTLRLADAPSHERLLVSFVEPAYATALQREGLVPGALVEIERKVALGGPIVLRLGASRLAVARVALRAVVVVRGEASPQ